MLWPIKPDRFAEDFFAEQLSHPHNAETLSDLFTGDHLPPETIRDGLINLAAAARHPRVQDVLFTLLRERAELATSVTATVIDAVIRYADVATAQALDERMPSLSTELLRPARDLAHHLLSTLPPDATPAQRAHRAYRLEFRLSEAGDKRGALELAREAVEIRSRLATAEPAAYLHGLAISLWASASIRNTHGIEIGTALTAVDEAIKIFQQLAERLPGVYRKYLIGARQTRSQLLTQPDNDRS